MTSHRPHGFVLGWLLLGMLALPALGQATPLARGLIPLKAWPAEKVKALAPILRSADIAVIESEPNGQMKQISLFTLVAAPGARVRQVLLDAQRYVDFARNFTVSKVTPRGNGSFDHFYQLSYGLFTIDGTHRYMPLSQDLGAQGASEDAASTAPVEVLDADEPAGTQRHYRWEFHDVGGATVVAVYGYTDLWHSGGMVGKLLERVPQIEHGMALVSQAALMLAMKQRAEQLTPLPPMLPVASSAPYDAFLARGVVALMRTQKGRLSELSIIDRSLAQPNQILDVVKQPAEWSHFIPTITKSADRGARDDLTLVDLEQSLPLIGFRSLYGVRVTGNAVDMMGVEGDMRGARMRFEAVAGRGVPTQIVMRSSQQFDRASLVIRQLYKLEPFFEYGVNLGLQLVVLRGIKNKAEQFLAVAPNAN